MIRARAPRAAEWLRPAFKVADACDALLGILHDLREQESEARRRDFRRTRLVQRSVVDSRTSDRLAGADGS